MKGTDIEREARKLVERYGHTGALTRAAGNADNARNPTQERYWEAVEQMVLTISQGSARGQA